MLDGVIVPVQQALFSILYFISVILWGLNQALLLVGYYILSITSWLSESMFRPLLESVGNSTDSLLLPVFTLAMLTLAITYLLGVFGVFRVVEFRSAITWMIVAVIWFQFGPELYLGFEQTRRELGGAFFATTFTDLTSGSGTIEGLGDIGDAGDLNINPPTNNFGAFLTFDTAIDGLDIALAYLNADGCDVLRTTGCLTFLMPDGSTGALPTRWYRADDYFDLTQHGFLYPGMTNLDRQASLDAAAAGIWRALSGMVVSLFGMLEQIVQLLLTIAFGIGFASFFIAILFAFFKKTESVTWAVFDVILGLFIQSIITSLLLALVMAFVSVAGATGNGILLLGVGFIGIILVTVLLFGAVSAILKSLNGLMGSFGAVTGGNLDAAGSITKLASAYATGGATLMGGGSLAQAAGSALGPGIGQKAYYAAQTFGSETALGGIAQQIAQGSAASYLGPVGGYALGRQNHQEDREESHESVSRKQVVSDLILGTPIRSSENETADDSPNLIQRQTQSMDARLDPIAKKSDASNHQDGATGLASDERQALHEQSSQTNNDGLSQDAIHRIDASDDDESAAIISSITRLSAMLGTSPAPSPTDSHNQSVSRTQMFLAEMERDFPGSTGHPELVQQYFPDHLPAPLAKSETVTVPIEILPMQQTMSTSSENERIHKSEDSVRSVRSVGPSTQEQLASFNITTAGQLANADPNQLASLERITPARANQLVQAAQAHIAPQESGSPARSVPVPVPQNSATLPSSASVAPSSSQIMATGGANYKVDGASLASHIHSAISTVSITGQIPSTSQAAQIARESGLPSIRESGQFVQVASAMNLSPQQAQSVIHDVQTTGKIGTEIDQSIRSSLSSFTLPTTGKPLDDSGMLRAVNNLERAAQALVSAANSLDGTRHSNGNPSTEDRINAGASSTRLQSATQSKS